MLEFGFLDGHARQGRWEVAPGQSVRVPGLIFPDTSFAAPPAWADCVLTGRPTGRPGIVELASGGTWFYPNESVAGLVVPAVQPAPTTQVQLLQVGQELAVFHDAVGWTSNPKQAVAALIEARTQATPGKLLWAPGIGTPQDYALWAYLGVDLFDASPLLLAASRAQVLGTDGAASLADVERLHGGTWDHDRLVAANLEAARQELERVRMAIEAGALRALVERRIYADPASVELLRRFDREHAYLAAAAPSHREAALPAMTGESLWMPEVEAFRRTLRQQYQPPAHAKVLLLIPCSRRKPYKTSRSHRQFARILDASGIRPTLHEVMVTSPLGLVPRELEEVYPAQAYDIPVTGHWSRDEEAVVRQQLAAILDAHEYDHVVVHTGQGTFDILRDLLPEARHTSLHHPTSREDLERLAAELERLRGLLGPMDFREAGRLRKAEDLRALATFQFGPAVADALVDGASAHGRMPFVKLVRGEHQVAMTTPGRGVLSLTLEGARSLARHSTKRVFIQDFRPKGTSSLFAVGVERADPDVRAGDEVVVVHGEEVRGCGVAQMSAQQMTHLRRGVAVMLRHSQKEAAA